MLRVLATALVLALSLQNPSLAQNLLENSEFDSTTTGWEAPGDLVLSHTSQDGFAAPGAAEVTGVLISPPFSNSTGIRQCLQLNLFSPMSSFEVSAAIKLVNFDGFMPQIVTTTHSDDDCDSIFLDQQNFNGVATQGFWAELQGTLSPIPPETQSIRLTLLVFTDSVDPGSMIRVDDAFFGVPVLFEDDFESGNTSSWALTVP